MPCSHAAYAALAAICFAAIPAEALPPQLMVVSLCTAEGVRDVAVPDQGDGKDAPRRGKDCTLACHAVTDRRKGTREEA